MKNSLECQIGRIRKIMPLSRGKLKIKKRQSKKRLKAAIKKEQVTDKETHTHHPSLLTLHLRNQWKNIFRLSKKHSNCHSNLEAW